MTVLKGVLSLSPTKTILHGKIPHSTRGDRVNAEQYGLTVVDWKVHKFFLWRTAVATGTKVRHK